MKAILCSSMPDQEDTLSPSHHPNKTPSLPWAIRWMEMASWVLLLLNLALLGLQPAEENAKPPVFLLVRGIWSKAMCLGFLVLHAWVTCVRLSFFHLRPDEKLRLITTLLQWRFAGVFLCLLAVLLQG